MERRVLIAVLSCRSWCSTATRRCFRRRPKPKPAQATSKAATAPNASGADAVQPDGVGPGCAASGRRGGRRRRRSGARHRGRQRRRARRVHHARRRAQELEAEEVSRRRRAAARADRRRTRRPIRRCPFTLAVDDAALSAKLAAAPFTVSAEAASTLTARWQRAVRLRDDAGRRARRRSSRFAPRQALRRQRQRVGHA